MIEKRYRYPSDFQFIKNQAKVVLVLLPLILIVLILFRSEYNLSTSDYRLAITTVSLGIFLTLFFIGSWCDIVMSNDGLYVEFLWKSLFVPWEKIRDIKYVGFRPFGYWVVLTNGALSIFHTIYAIGTVPLLPSFHIHEKIESRDYLLSTIRGKLPKNMKNKNSPHKQ